ncbi:uroporphyrinogen-III C-methyltransferase [Hymenobacter nivis]|uniref:uroporphyrinogen-III C-methyltransferase n=1 Tax=Hymenobacter nivis TaxID=1850093 RepID=A0A502H123_9BACT|nr:uroporphyrinogen-III C-methyltransferase [Hymenobacter nivis]TPG67138.1 uroporphyrinogen-III C-methyltransferase [Hymenobacter nivis]
MANSPLFVPRLTVVGAGPGDPELLTLKGARVLAAADVVLYDALANDDLLTHARPGVPRLFVGKRRGAMAYTQLGINELIVQQAFKHGHVVRLKGGDPFVFGRGREEMLYAEAHGLATEYVPGISSAVAAAGSMGIPATHRGLSEGFRVLTATTADEQLSGALLEAAQSPRTTTVILMGMGRLAEIMALFGRYGGADVPAAVVQNGTLPTARAVTGTVATIAERARRAGLGAPAVIVLGEVVRLAKLPAQEADASAVLPSFLHELLPYAKVA